MVTEIGRVEAIFRYPVKSMGGERLESAELGWHGIEGDRRLAFRRINDRSGFPFLTAGKLPELVLFAPQDPPTHVRTPDGELMPVFSEELAAEVGRRYGAPVEMMQMKHGIFDDACISVIASDTCWRFRGWQGAARMCGDFARIFWCVCCERFRFRKMSGWAVCSRSATETVLLPSR
jgi:hypothetical protein